MCLGGGGGGGMFTMTEDLFGCGIVMHSLGWAYSRDVLVSETEKQGVKLKNAEI